MDIKDNTVTQAIMDIMSTMSHEDLQGHHAISYIIVTS
jgi:hypothetical protein